MPVREVYQLGCRNCYGILAKGKGLLCDYEKLSLI